MPFQANDRARGFLGSPVLKARISLDETSLAEAWYAVWSRQVVGENQRGHYGRSLRVKVAESPRSNTALTLGRRETNAEGSWIPRLSPDRGHRRVRMHACYAAAKADRSGGGTLDTTLDVDSISNTGSS